MSVFPTHTAARMARKKTKKKPTEVEEPATNATPLTDPTLSQHQTTECEKEKHLDMKDTDSAHSDSTHSDSAHSELVLEEALDAAVRNASVDDIEDTQPHEEDRDVDLKKRVSSDTTDTPGKGGEREEREEGGKVTKVETGKEKQRSSKLRLVLKPLPSEEEELEGGQRTREGCREQCAECAKGQSSSAESACRDKEGAGKYSSCDSVIDSKDEQSSHRESQLPLPSSPGINVCIHCIYIPTCINFVHVHCCVCTLHNIYLKVFINFYCIVGIICKFFQNPQCSCIFCTTFECTCTMYMYNTWHSKLRK